MSYKPVVVTLRRDPKVRLEEQLDRAVDPFTHGPRYPEGTSRCEGWWIGGHWAGHFLSRQKDGPDLVKPIGFPPESPLFGYVACDGGPKGQLDLERLRSTAEEAVWRRWPTRAAELLGTHWFWQDRATRISPEEVERFYATTAAMLSQARGRALIRAGLVTLEGEWVEEEDTWTERDTAYSRADAYIASLDDEAWLVCLTVHF